ncbi:MAG: hypothetical protein AAFO93_13815 [Pseudomonadota bacterium]
MPEASAEIDPFTTTVALEPEVKMPSESDAISPFMKKSWLDPVPLTAVLEKFTSAVSLAKKKIDPVVAPRSWMVVVTVSVVIAISVMGVSLSY